MSKEHKHICCEITGRIHTERTIKNVDKCPYSWKSAYTKRVQQHFQPNKSGKAKKKGVHSGDKSRDKNHLNRNTVMGFHCADREGLEKAFGEAMGSGGGKAHIYTV